MQVLQFFKKELVNDLCLDDKKFLNILLQCLVFGLLVFLSLFWNFFFFIAIIALTVFGCLQKNGKALYFYAFTLPLISLLVPLVSVFSLSEYTLAFHSLTIGIICLNLAIRLLISVIKKQAKFNIAFSIIAVILVAYVWIFKASTLTALSFTSSIFFLWTFVHFKKDVNFKHIVILICLGTLLNIAFGFLYKVSPRLQSITLISYAYDKIRFVGSSGNTNVMAAILAVCLASLYILIINKDFKILFYPLVIIFSICLIATISKSGLIIYAIATLLFFVLYLIYNHKKKNFVVCALILVSLLVGPFVKLNTLRTTLDRLKQPFTTEQANTQTTTDSEEPSSAETTEEQEQEQKQEANIASDLTTGRSDMWKQYISTTLKTTKSALFGFGIGATPIGQYNDLERSGPHNLFVLMLYYFGIVGILLFLVTILLAINFKNIKPLNFVFVILLITLLLCVCTLDYTSTVIIGYLIILFSSYSYRIKKDDV